MAYLGNSPVLSQQEYRNIDNISGSFNGSTTSFALLVNGVAPVPAPQSSNQCLISVNGVVQKPDDTGATGFRISGGNIIFSSAPTGGQSFFGVILAGADYIYAGENFPDGTVSAPSITFAQDLDTGFFRSGAGEIKYTANGTAVVTLSSNNLTAPSFIPTSSSAPTNGVYLPAVNSVGISTNSSERLRINSSGNVGIGSSAPGAKLTIQQAANTITEGLLLVASSGSVNGGWYHNGSALVGREGGFDTINLAAGKVGIGTTTPSSNLHISSSGDAELRITSGAASQAILRFGNGVDETLGSIRFNSPDDSLQFYGLNDAERMRIDSSGRLLVGTSSARTDFANSTATPRIQQEATDYNGSSLSLVRNSNNAGNGELIFGKSRGTSLGGVTVVAADDTLGGIRFDGSDGTDFATGALISAQVDGTPGANDMPGRLVFSTTSDGASSPTERMRITNAGSLGLGTSSPDTRLHISTGGNDTTIRLENTTTGVTGGTSFGNIEFEGNDSSTGSAGVLAKISGIAPRTQDGSTTNGGALAFHTSTIPLTLVEQMRLECNGDLQFNSGFGSIATAYGCRAWVNFNGTSTVSIRANGNVSSITDNGTGDYTVNLTTAMPDANYAVSGITGSNGNGNRNIESHINNTGSTRVNTLRSSDGSLQDVDIVCVQIFR